MLGVTTAAIVTRGSSSILKQEGARFGGRSFAARFPARRTNFAERLGEDRFIASSRDAFSAQSEDQRVADGVQKWKKPRGSWGFFLKSPRGEGVMARGKTTNALSLLRFGGRQCGHFVPCTKCRGARTASGSAKQRGLVDLGQGQV